MKKQHAYLFSQCYFDFKKIEIEIQRQADEHLTACLNGNGDGAFQRLTLTNGKVVFEMAFTDENVVEFDLDKLLTQEVNKFARHYDDRKEYLNALADALEKLAAKARKAA